MITPVPDAALTLQVHLASGAAPAGSTIAVAVLGIARRDLVLVGAEIALVRSVAWRYNQGALGGGSFSSQARRSTVASTLRPACSGPLAAGQYLRLDADLQVPAPSLGSAVTRLVEVKWSVRVRIAVQGARFVEATEDVEVTSPALDQVRVTHNPPRVVERRLVALGLESLSSRQLVPGSPIFGDLVVTPKRPGSGRGLRVELVLREQVHRGIWVGEDPARNPGNQSKEAETVVARARVAQHIELDPHHPISLPFRLQAPTTLPCPSMSTTEFTLTWLLRGVLDRPLRPDPFVELELHGSTMAPPGAR